MPRCCGSAPVIRLRSSSGVSPFAVIDPRVARAVAFNPDKRTELQQPHDMASMGAVGLKQRWHVLGAHSFTCQANADQVGQVIVTPGDGILVTEGTAADFLSL